MAEIRAFMEFNPSKVINPRQSGGGERISPLIRSSHNIANEMNEKNNQVSSVTTI